MKKFVIERRMVDPSGAHVDYEHGIGGFSPIFDLQIRLYDTLEEAARRLKVLIERYEGFGVDFRSVPIELEFNVRLLEGE
jgi:hypothetical protein